MGSDSDACCDAMKQRIIPRITKSDTNGTERKSSAIKRKGFKEDSNEKKESVEERIVRIDQTKVTFMEFWYECLDWEMLRLFFGLLLLFFTMVGIASLLYLMFVFNYREKLWYFYFPVGKREEL